MGGMQADEEDGFRDQAWVGCGGFGLWGGRRFIGRHGDHLEFDDDLVLDQAAGRIFAKVIVTNGGSPRLDGRTR